ncbi:transposase [Paenibacillus timonensis]|uniref:Transposase n=1 Tax=Paenibacillus timonensis TaxID=225915 RepID=A0ABW3SEW9_9BACL|nr:MULTISPECIES: transposase [Paenibacillus]MCH1641922.1 transposase [Paenibacillus timonensis]MDU2241464.1 IS1595 family transposase [Paenibacillus sp.]
MENNMGVELHTISNRYASEEACMEALIATKWPNGFVCPRCGYNRCTRLSSRRIPLFECEGCSHQTSPLVGTIFEGTHLPLLKWFQALELFLLPDGISAMRLSKVIRVTYKTAWLMLHKIRHTLGEFDARKLLSGEVKVNSDQYGKNPYRCYRFPHPYASAVVAGCSVTESGEPEHVKIHLVPQKRGNGARATRRELAAFINGQVDVQTSIIQSYPLAFRLYTPLRKVVREAWESLKNTYVALGPKYLQAYLNEYTGRRELRLPGMEEVMLQKLLHMGVAIPTITYDKLIERQPNPAFAAAA